MRLDDNVMIPHSPQPPCITEQKQRVHRSTSYYLYQYKEHKNNERIPPRCTVPLGESTNPGSFKNVRTIICLLS